MKTTGRTHPWLTLQAERNPDGRAVVSGEGQLTFLNVYERAKQTAASLSEEGIGAGSHVAIVLQNSERYYVLLHALTLLRAVIVPINIRLTADEIARQIEFADCSHVISDNRIDKIKQKPVRTSSDTLLLLFTSGTSGEPKCVELTCQNIFYNALATKLRLKMTNKDSWLLSLPLYHIGGISIVMRSVMYGIPVGIPSALDTDAIMAAMNDYDPAVVSLVPTMMHRILGKRMKPNPAHRAILLGGGPVPGGLLDRAGAEGWKIATTYGATETSSQIATRSPDDAKHPGSAGQALPFNRLHIVDESGNEMQSEEEGEITVQTPSLMHGYYKREDLTAQNIRNNRYYTGDYGYLTGDRYLFVLSRRSDLIVSGGENINPSEVEDELRRYFTIRDVCVFPYADAEWGEVVAAAVVTDDDSITHESIARLLDGKLASYKIPKKIFVVQSLPYTAHGKRNRRKIGEQIIRNFR